MRSKQEMMHLILSFAKMEERIKVVGMEGSRANRAIEKDDFQDYDITYLVTDMAPFVDNEEWLDIFGERIFMQNQKRCLYILLNLGIGFRI